MTGDPTASDGRPNEEAPQDSSARPEDKKAKTTARETGISEDQAMQLQRSTDGSAELDSAAEAAARWS